MCVRKWFWYWNLVFRSHLLVLISFEYVPTCCRHCMDVVQPELCCQPENLCTRQQHSNAFQVWYGWRRKVIRNITKMGQVIAYCISLHHFTIRIHKVNQNQPVPQVFAKTLQIRGNGLRLAKVLLNGWPGLWSQVAVESTASKWASIEAWSWLASLFSLPQANHGKYKSLNSGSWGRSREELRRSQFPWKQRCPKVSIFQRWPSGLPHVFSKMLSTMPIGIRLEPITCSRKCLKRHLVEGAKPETTKAVGQNYFKLHHMISRNIPI